MALVTFQVLEGVERGEIYGDLPTPISIGREEDNHIRLNDERVSRFHAKVQEHDGKLILTDLESTNGTRVNGHPVKMRVLQIGDQVLIGRCLILYGSPEQMAERRLPLPSPEELPDESPYSDERSRDATIDPSLELFEQLFPGGPPELPEGLSPVHTAQVSDLLAYVHSELLRVLLLGQEDINAQQTGQPPRILLPADAWHELQALQMHLASYLRLIADPRDDE